jgi:hypothetical protein
MTWHLLGLLLLLLLVTTTAHPPAPQVTLEVVQPVQQARQLAVQLLPRLRAAEMMTRTAAAAAAVLISPQRALLAVLLQAHQVPM